MNQNFCMIRKNKIYEELFDELYDEELSMNTNEHNDKIKYFIEKKIFNSSYIQLSSEFNNQDVLLENIINNIVEETSNKNLQGNTLLMWADDNEMYELFYMEDLTKSAVFEQSELNEFGSLTNIFLQPVYWGCGILKTTYNSGCYISSIISKKDIAKIYIANFYHTGIMLGTDDSINTIEFTGEDPYKVIGGQFYQTPTITILGLSIVIYLEKTNETNNSINKIASKLLKTETTGRVFMTLVCPNTNKKFWDLSETTIQNILKILNNKKLLDKFESLETKCDEINSNPFYIINHVLYSI